MLSSKSAIIITSEFNFVNKKAAGDYLRLKNKKDCQKVLTIGILYSKMVAQRAKPVRRLA
nr:MAG TPA: hypothetical protein [Caudoviricetes sp.]